MGGSKGTRQRTTSGGIRSKRADTLVGSIEKQYNVNLGVRSDMELGNLLKQEGFDSLSELLRDKKTK
jgi:hypothetical protein